MSDPTSGQSRQSSSRVVSGHLTVSNAPQRSALNAINHPKTLKVIYFPENKLYITEEIMAVFIFPAVFAGGSARGRRWRCVTEPMWRKMKRRRACLSTAIVLVSIHTHTHAHAHFVWIVLKVKCCPFRWGPISRGHRGWPPTTGESLLPNRPSSALVRRTQLNGKGTRQVSLLWLVVERAVVKTTVISGCHSYGTASVGCTIVTLTAKWLARSAVCSGICFPALFAPPLGQNTSHSGQVRARTEWKQSARSRVSGKSQPKVPLSRNQVSKMSFGTDWKCIYQCINELLFI